MVAYNRDIPDAPNNPSTDQPLMKINTNAIDTLIAVDHISFNATDGGYHTVIHQKPTIDPVNVAGVGQTYVKTASGDQNLFFESGLGTIYQLTGFAKNLASNGYLTLPGGLIVQWGTNTSSNGSTINFPTAFITACYVVVPQIKDTANRQFVYSNTYTTTTFKVAVLDSSGSGETGTFTWIALGK